MWRSYRIGRGKEISFDQLVLKGQGDTGIVVSEKFFPLHDARDRLFNWPFFFGDRGSG